MLLRKQINTLLRKIIQSFQQYYKCISNTAENYSVIKKIKYYEN